MNDETNDLKRGYRCLRFFGKLVAGFTYLVICDGVEVN